MGVIDRKEREKVELKKKILEAAKKLFLEKGINQTSIRNIAEIIEYSPATIYLYFEDKDTILHQLHQEGFAELRARMEDLLKIENPMERLYQKGLIYLQFAKENPDLYDLMFIAEAPIDYIRKKSCEEWSEGRSTFNFLHHTIQQAMGAGYFKGHDSESLAFTIWSAVHGMCALWIRNRIMTISDKNQDEILENAYQSFWKMLQNNS